MNFPSKIFFNDINHGYRVAILEKNALWLLPFYMVVATYFYYEKVRRTMRTAIVSNLLNVKKKFHSLLFPVIQFKVFLYIANTCKQPTFPVYVNHIFILKNWLKVVSHHEQVVRLLAVIKHKKRNKYLEDYLSKSWKTRTYKMDRRTYEHISISFFFGTAS